MMATVGGAKLERDGSLVCQMLRLLSDERLCSAERLCSELAVAPSELEDLVRLGQSEFQVAIVRLPESLFRLGERIEWLEKASILGHLSPQVADQITDLTIFDLVGSTNDAALDSARAGAPAPSVFLAEGQTRGRGRRGRSWISPFGTNLYLSVYFRMQSSLEAMTGLSLCAGVAAADGIGALGCEKVGLKWPNDLVWDGRKLGGILVDVSGREGEASSVVVGVGVNLQEKTLDNGGITQPWICLRELMNGALVSRNALASAIIDRLVSAVQKFDRSGFHTFSAQWERLDSYRGRFVTLQTPRDTFRGICRGVGSRGELLLESEGGLQQFFNGEISMRVDT